MPTYRSCGDRFLGRWKQGEGEIDGERRFTEESERKRRTKRGENAAIRSVYGVLRLCFYACGTSACSPSTLGSTAFCSDARGLSGKRGSHLCERRWKQTSNDHSLPVPSPFGCRSADCAERRECGVREGGEEGGCRLGPSAFHLR